MKKKEPLTTLDNLPELDFENEGPQYPEGGSA